MRFIFVIGFLLICSLGWTQQLTLSGKVVDKITAEALPFASVIIKGRPIGTVANGDGDFDFHFDAIHRNDIIVISMLGYQSFEAPIWTLVNGGINRIALEKSVTLLGEVVVTDSLNGGEILRIALARITQNFPMQPFLLDGFYRDIKKVNGTAVALLEAAVKIYDENYAEPRNKSKLREHVKLVEVRQSLGYDNKFTSYFDQRNLLEDLLLHNSVRYHQEVADEVFEKITREEDTQYDGHEVFVVSYDQELKLKVFIDQQDYGIIHIDFAIDYIGDELDKRKNMVNKFIGYTKKIDFRRIDGKMFLNYITVNTREKWYDNNTQALSFETELTQYLLINEVHSPANAQIASTERMRNYGLQYQDYPYNKEFWSRYNVIKETPLDKKMVEDLERETPLEKQFEAD